MPLKFKFTFERVILLLVSLSFLFGIGYGLPSTTVVNDEMYFVGGVFRALEAGTIFPQGLDLPYGTINYLLSYVLIGLVLVVLWPFFGFNIGALKLWVINHYFIFYLVPRFVSVLAGLGLLYLVYRLLKENVESSVTRSLIVTLLFTNLSTICVLRTGKVWVLSTFLVFGSFYYLYRVLAGDRQKSLLVVLFSALASANFPLAAVSLASWPFLWLFYDRRGWVKSELYRYWVGGMILIAIIFGLNYHGIQAQVLSIVNDYTLSEVAQLRNVGLVDSFRLNLVKILLLFAPIVAVIVFSCRRIKNNNLFWLAATFLLSYVAVISVVARWSTHTYSYLRYLFPVGFFLVVILMTSGDFTTKSRKIILWLATIVSLVFFVQTTIYLMRPTTFNLATDWVINNINDDESVIINHVGLEVDLPLNKESAELIQEKFCASRCHFARVGLLKTNFLPLVINEQSTSNHQLSRKTIYHIFDRSTQDPRLGIVYQVSNPYHYDWPHTIESLGDYFDPTFFRVDNLGKNLYIYREI